MEVLNYYDGSLIKDDTKIYELKSTFSTKDQIINGYVSIGNIETLEEAKARRIEELTKNVDKWFAENPLISPLIDGVPKAYDCTLNNRINLMQMISTMQIEQLAGRDPLISFYSIGNNCIHFTQEEIMALAIQMKDWCYPIENFCTEAKAKITNAKTIEEVNNIIIDFDYYKKINNI